MTVAANLQCRSRPAFLAIRESRAPSCQGTRDAYESLAWAGSSACLRRHRAGASGGFAHPPTPPTGAEAGRWTECSANVRWGSSRPSWGGANPIARRHRPISGRTSWSRPSSTWRRTAARPRRRTAPGHPQRRDQAATRREMEAALARIFTQAADAIVTIDADQRIMMFNHAAEQLFGCPASEALGSHASRFVPEPLLDPGPGSRASRGRGRRDRLAARRGHAADGHPPRRGARPDRRDGHRRERPRPAGVHGRPPRRHARASRWRNSFAR